jgi:hypothetical protein
VLPSVTVPEAAPGALIVAGFGVAALLMLTAVPETGTAAGFQFPVVNQSADTVPSQSAAWTDVAAKTAVEAKRNARNLRSSAGLPAPRVSPINFFTIAPYSYSQWKKGAKGAGRAHYSNE